MDKESVKLALQSSLSMLAFVARMTPTTWDDNAIASLAILVEKPWFVEFVTYLLNLLQQGDIPKYLEDEIKQLFQSASQE